MGGKKAGTIIREALEYYKRNFLRLLIATLIIYGLSYLIGQIGIYVQALLGLDSKSLALLRKASGTDNFWLMLLSGLLSLTFSVLTFTVMINLNDVALHLCSGKKLTFTKIAGNFLHRWARYVGITAWSLLWVVLWAFLLFVPGIVKYFSYLFAPYLMIEYPDMTVRQALQKSKEMTKGYKGRMFCVWLAIELPLLIVMIAVLILANSAYGTVMRYISPVFGLLLMPPLYVAMTLFYQDAKKAAVNGGILKNSNYPQKSIK